MTPVTVITGASAGIGAELARVFAEHGHALVLVARREQRLEALAAEIAAAGRPTPLVLPIDLAQPNAAARIGEALAARGLEPQYIVNNAGFGLVGRAADLDLAEQLGDDRSQRARADRPVARLRRQPRAPSRRPAQRRVGGGLPAGAGLGGLLRRQGLSCCRSARRCTSSLKPLGVRVTCLCPGPVATEFQARAGIAEATRRGRWRCRPSGWPRPAIAA